MPEAIQDLRDDRVSPVWKWVAAVAVGVVLGGAPAYVSLMVDAHETITRKDVDQEISLSNAPIVTGLSDLKEQVKDLTGEVHELRKLK